MEKYLSLYSEALSRLECAAVADYCDCLPGACDCDFSDVKTLGKLLPDTFQEQIKSGNKMDCPCCGRYAQIYSRRIHATIARKLINLYNLGGDDRYVHTSRLILDGESGIGDFSKAKYWKLIQEAENTNDGKRTSGNWKLTEKGVGFVLNLITIPKSVKIFDDRVFGFSEEHVNIKECLDSGGFDYAEIMKA